MCLYPPKKVVRWSTELKVFYIMSLSVTTAATKPDHWTNLRLFGCFESCKLIACVTQDTQFTVIEFNRTTLWEEIDVAWLTRVRAIIEKSIPAPKSPVKLGAVMDLWRRAIAGYLAFRSMGSNRCRELPEFITEASALEICRIEREVAGSRQNANFEAESSFWFCDREWVSESDEFEKTGSKKICWGSKTGISKKRESSGKKRSIPVAGSEFEIPRRTETFGGFVKPGERLVVESVVEDHFGDVFLNLSRGGRVVISGMSFSEV